MKSWLLYFFAVIISLFSVAAASNYIYADYASPRLRLMDGDKLCEISVEEYALRVLLAENKSCIDAEAQRALAVSARSVGLYLAMFGCKHSDYDACTDGDCCIMLGKADEVSQDFFDQCQKAVEDTAGIALFYNDLPAMALFCLCSGDASEKCPQYSYLTAVKNQDTCQIHTEQQLHSYSVLTPLLLKEVDYNSAKENSLLVYGENGKCDFGIIAGKKLSAQQIKTVLNLKSNQFILKFTENGIQSTAVGIGHGYGMSLCHADGLSKKGYSYIKILEHFYPDLVLKKLYNN